MTRSAEKVCALRDALRQVTEALDDAIKAHVNGLGHAGWTQEDYDSWSAAREVGGRLLRDTDPASTEAPDA